MDLFYSEEDKKFHTYPDGDIATHEEIRRYYQNITGLKGYVHKSLLTQMLREINIDIERNRRRKMEHTQDNNSNVFSQTLIAYDPEVVKLRIEHILREVIW